MLELFSAIFAVADEGTCADRRRMVALDSAAGAGEAAISRSWRFDGEGAGLEAAVASTRESVRVAGAVAERRWTLLAAADSVFCKCVSRVGLDLALDADDIGATDDFGLALDRDLRSCESSRSSLGIVDSLLSRRTVCGVGVG